MKTRQAYLRELIFGLAAQASAIEYRLRQRSTQRDLSAKPMEAMVKNAPERTPFVAARAHSPPA